MPDILDQIDDVITDWYGSEDSMHWSPPKPVVEAHPLEIERRTNPGMALMREQAHVTGIDGYASAAYWQWRRNRDLKAFTTLFLELGETFQQMFKQVSKEAAKFVASLNHLLPKNRVPLRGRSRRYQQQIRQLHRRNR